jgi:membrane fusion protein (multidrug efflux system)
MTVNFNKARRMTQTPFNVGDRIPPRTAIVSALVIGAALAGTVAYQRCSPRAATNRDDDVSISNEWLATFEEAGKADVNAEVSGNLIGQDYASGSFVSKGQLLFQIDPTPFAALLDEARVRLAKAQSDLRHASAVLRLKREDLVAAVARHQHAELDVGGDSTVAQQHYLPQKNPEIAARDEVAAKAEVFRRIAEVESASTRVVGAIAAVRSFEGMVRKAATNLALTNITSPITGIAANPQIKIGSLVKPGAGSIATVSVLDPIRAAFTVSAQDFAGLAQTDARSTNLDLVLADGTDHSLKGSLSFAACHGDAKSGDGKISGLFANPSYRLRPGQHALVRVVKEVRHGRVGGEV